MIEYELETLPKQLRTKSSMVYLGERIAFGSECELMDIAANEIEKLKAERDRYREALKDIILLAEDFEEFGMHLTSIIVTANEALGVEE